MNGISVEKVSSVWPNELLTRLETIIPIVLTNEVLNNIAAMVYLVDAPTIQELNNTWRGKNKPTNVLSFPQEPGETGDNPENQSAGDVFLCYEQLVQEADAAAKPVDHHAIHLLVHGLLHLLGYTHDDDANAAAMQAVEVNILHSLHLPNPYDP